MNLEIQTAAVPRKVVAVDVGRLFFPELIDILNVIFVRNKRLTSRPVPLKYIREAFHTVPEEVKDEADVSSNDVCSAFGIWNVIRH